MTAADSITITLKSVSKHFGKVKALDRIDLQFAPGTLTTLLGPSGCGKTTLLRLIAGLEMVTSGEIWFGEENITVRSATQRDVGMVFQSYALFPHMTVAQNVGYGLGVLKTDPVQIRDQVRQALQMVNLDGYQRRYPDELSGGQQQRVAVARAMVLEPKVLLFDEPLSNIDSKLRRSMREDIRNLQQTSGITSVYVTHDQAEALAVSDEVVVIREGRIEQQGPPKALYHRPSTPFVANFIGESNVVAGELHRQGGQQWVQLGKTRIQLPAKKEIQAPPGPVQLSLRPEIMQIQSTMEPDDPALAGSVIHSAYMGPIIEYTIATEAGEIFTRTPAHLEQYRPGAKVYLHILPEELILIADASTSEKTI
ncbi:MAG: ABC transporter ATP-binding protein [Desulfobacterales bacterium]